MKVLQAGGSAVDAAVAVQATLGLVEPQSSGLGGGAFLTYYDAKTAKKVTAYNGRETAPAGATPDMFLGPDGKSLPRPVAMTSGRLGPACPSAVAMLYLAQGQHGKPEVGRPLRRRRAAGRPGLPRAAADGRGRLQPRRPGCDPGRHRLFHQARWDQDPGRRPPGKETRPTPRRYARSPPRGRRPSWKGSIGEQIVAKLHERPDPRDHDPPPRTWRAISPKEATPAVCRPYRVYVRLHPAGAVRRPRAVVWRAWSSSSAPTSPSRGRPRRAGTSSARRAG